MWYFTILLCVVTVYSNGVTYKTGRIADLPADHPLVTKTSQATQTVGVSFAFAFLNSHLNGNDTSYTENLSITITNPSNTDALVQITSSYTGFTAFNVTVSAGKSKNTAITPPDVQVDYKDSNINKAIIETKAIFVTSSVGVSLVTNNFLSNGNGGDKTSIIPICQLGKQYQIVADQSSGTDVWSAASTNIVTIISLQDGTNVSIPMLLSSSATLDKGQTLTVATTRKLGYFTVMATNNVAVLSGAVCGYGLYNPTNCSYEALMLYPSTSYGNTVPYFKFLPEDQGEFVITFQKSNTTILFDGVNEFSHTFDPTWYITVYVPTGLMLTANNPIDASVQGNTNQAGFGGPFFTNVVVPSMFTSNPVTFATGVADDYPYQHFVRVVTSINQIGQIAVDGYAPNGMLYTRMGKGDFYYVDVMVIPGQHIVSPMTSGAQFGVTVYGYTKGHSYGFTPGLELPSSC